MICNSKVNAKSRAQNYKAKKHLIKVIIMGSSWENRGYLIVGVFRGVPEMVIFFFDFRRRELEGKIGPFHIGRGMNEKNWRVVYFIWEESVLEVNF